MASVTVEAAAVGKDIPLPTEVEAMSGDSGAGARLDGETTAGSPTGEAAVVLITYEKESRRW